jgi:protein-S-isoprenylcysteine O-methyltransferase Ste14
VAHSDGLLPSLVEFVRGYLRWSIPLIGHARHSEVSAGPYRWIRHLLYLWKEIAVVGIVLHYLSLVAVLMLVAHIAIQIWCILYEEEELLRRTFPGICRLPTLELAIDPISMMIAPA